MANLDLAQLGFLEIGVDPGAIAWDDVHQSHAGQDILAGANIQARDDTGDGCANDGAVFVGLRLFQLGFGGSELGPWAEDLGFVARHLGLGLGLDAHQAGIGGVELDQDIAGLDRLRVIDGDAGDRRRDERGNHDLPGIDIGIVGFNIAPAGQPHDNGNNGNHDEDGCGNQEGHAAEARRSGRVGHGTSGSG